MTETVNMSYCAKTRTRKTTVPFYCRKTRGHDGKCSPYTLALPTRERWDALTPNHCECGACECGCQECKNRRTKENVCRGCGAQWFGFRDVNCAPVCANCGTHLAETGR